MASNFCQGARSELLIFSSLKVGKLVDEDVDIVDGGEKTDRHAKVLIVVFSVEGRDG